MKLQTLQFYNKSKTVRRKKNHRLYRRYICYSFLKKMALAGSWSDVGGAHIQAFTFSSQDHGRLSDKHISKHSLFRLKITVVCRLSTCPSIHLSLDEDTLKITVGCLVCGVVCVCGVLCLVCACGVCGVWVVLLWWCVCVVCGEAWHSLSLALSPSSSLSLSLSLSFSLLSLFFSLLFLFFFSCSFSYSCSCSCSFSFSSLFSSRHQTL